MKRSIIMVLAAVLAVFTVFSVFTVFATETVTNTQMLDMCSDADNYIDANGAVPQIIYTDAGHTNSVSAAEFYYMMSRWLRWYKNNSAPPGTVSIVRGTLGPTSPSGTESGTIQLADILAKGESNANFIDSNSQLPNYSTVGSTQYTTKAMFWVFDRTMQWYRDNSSMPTYATVKAVNPPSSWTGGPTPTPGPTATPTPTPTPGAYPWSKNLSVPYTAQPDEYTCGPTSLKMVMQYHGVTKTVSEISDYMASIGDSPYYDGVARETIVSAAHHYGFSTAADKTGWTNLKNSIAANRPAIAHLRIHAGGDPRYYPSGNPVYSEYNSGHYIVVRGLQADANGNVLYVIVNDPSKGSNLNFTYNSFNNCWSEYGSHMIPMY